VFILKIMWIKKYRFTPVQFFIISLTIFILYFILYLPTAMAAESAQLSFSPGQAEVRAGKDLNIKVHINTGDQAVNVVQADVSYPLSLFDPAKSKVYCSKTFPTSAQHVVNGTINVNGSSKGLIKIACAVPVNGGTAVLPFSGEADIATISLRARPNAPSVHDNKMLEFVVDQDLSDGHNNYSAVARASDSKNILGSTSAANIILNSQSNTYRKIDVNQDTRIDKNDIAKLITDFGKKGSSADINNDRIVNCTDLSILLSSQ
jgi:hypothetical protein